MAKLTVTEGGQAFVDPVGIVPGMIVGARGQVGAVIEISRDFDHAEVVHVLAVDDNGELFIWGTPTHAGLDEVSGELDPIHFADDVRLLGTTFHVTSVAPLANDLDLIGQDVAEIVGEGVVLDS